MSNAISLYRSLTQTGNVCDAYLHKFEWNLDSRITESLWLSWHRPSEFVYKRKTVYQGCKIDIYLISAELKS